MNFRFLALSALLGLSSAASLAAPVTTVDFSEFSANTLRKAVKSVTEEGFTVSNDCANIKSGRKPLETCLMSDASGRGNKRNVFAYNVFNASTTTLAREDGHSFNFESIDLDEYLNLPGSVFSDYSIDFSFSYADGSHAKKTVQLDRRTGFQTFQLNERNLLNASWISSKSVYFDKLRTSNVPEPASLALTLLALGGLAYSRRNSKRA